MELHFSFSSTLRQIGSSLHCQADIELSASTRSFCLSQPQTLSAPADSPFALLITTPSPPACSVKTNLRHAFHRSSRLLPVTFLQAKFQRFDFDFPSIHSVLISFFSSYLLVLSFVGLFPRHIYLRPRWATRVLR
ncbi:hypothetical protein D9619_011213 [Psilocybe cf. subviscida]|uniref:Uncharacterized protein n=1 Tax=Psilocybe cf. subviscida TaxID=2480587 RepID=A0A8H5BKP4_9AGAR|nr:hypothetical protein D9619_011213 [Psilocybe cf. subviscida]